MGIVKRWWFWVILVILVNAWVVIYHTSDKTTQPQSQAVQPQTPAPAPPPAKRTPKEEKAWESRNIDRAALEQTFLQAGLDVVVGNMGNPGSDDNRSLVVKGDPVNRPLVYNFLDRDARNLLKKDGFTKVTFMRHGIGDWIAEYYPQTDKLTWD